MQDTDIISLLFARNEQAIWEIQRKYGAKCESLAMRILHDRQDSEECVSDAYLEAWNTIPPQNPRSLEAYLYRLTRCLSFDRFRQKYAKKRSAGEILPLEDMAECLPADAPDDGTLAALLETFLSGLEEDERNLFVGRYWYNYSPAALADGNGLSRNAVNLRLMRTREKLRVFLRKEGYNYD